jgi:hypothetical protein
MRALRKCAQRCCHCCLAPRGDGAHEKDPFLEEERANATISDFWEVTESPFPAADDVEAEGIIGQEARRARLIGRAIAEREEERRSAAALSNFEHKRAMHIDGSGAWRFQSRDIAEDEALGFTLPSLTHAQESTINYLFGPAV